ncbi:efflux RND transporter periplasmic adaptor subunit [Shinella zoogloeoides]|uniref:efflux RND transporter periplasmic adaptor subunit n=1 Tax=Shinella zoogloeoides TaxID=352475 RepID=UPI00273E4F05|nr:efflux RND transporter periplasmic adaptor subunit [Shinella zoogloeoides]WLR91613.1 efflux RND transporter periplasmic adaptor subunit [Shinella zoogloeoides]
MRTSLPLAMAVLAAMTLAGCNKEEETAAPPRPVLSVVVTPTALPGTRFAGTVQARVQAALGSRVAGRLVSRGVHVGDLVKKGDVLAVLDATAYELAVRSARAELSSAEATLASAVAAEERQKTLLQSNAAAKAAVESAEQSREAADAGLIRARTALVKAEEQLSYTQILAEFDGVVVATGAEVGQTVSPGEAIVTVARPDERDAVVDIPETAEAIAIGSRFTVSLQINPAITVKGSVREVAPSADAVTRTRRVKIALENPPETVRLGTTITAELEGPDLTAIMVPETAVLQKDGKPHVWLVDAGKGEVHLAPVETGAAVGRYLPVASGLKDGDRVVTAGVNSLEEGQKIKIEDEASL